jgi:chromosome segregation ATPase
MMASSSIDSLNELNTVIDNINELMNRIEPEESPDITALFLQIKNEINFGENYVSDITDEFDKLKNRFKLLREKYSKEAREYEKILEERKEYFDEASDYQKEHENRKEYYEII